jgi:hypothetical protein
LKCYVHRDVDAIGVCSECGQGVCDACAVRIAGKLYCKEDADRVFGGSKKEEIEFVRVMRPMRVMVASVFFFLYSGVGIGIGIFFIAAGFLSGIVSSVPNLTSIATTSVGLLGFGGLLVIMGILGVICGLWLWKVQTWGAVVGIPLLIGGLAIASILMWLFPVLFFYEVGGSVWFVNVIMTIILLASWTKLKSSQEVEF